MRRRRGPRAETVPRNRSCWKRLAFLPLERKFISLSFVLCLYFSTRSLNQAFSQSPHWQRDTTGNQATAAQEDLPLYTELTVFDAVAAHQATASSTSSSKRPSSVLLARGQTPLFERMEIAVTHLTRGQVMTPNGFRQQHSSLPQMFIVVHGEIHVTTTSPGQLDPVKLTTGGLIVSEDPTANISRLETIDDFEKGDATVLSFYFRPRESASPPPSISSAPRAPFFRIAPSHFLNPKYRPRSVQIFFDELWLLGMRYIKVFSFPCLHEPHPDVDHEVLFFVEYLPKTFATLFLLPEDVRLHEGTVMFWPLDSLHGIVARRDDNNRTWNYYANKGTRDVPRCICLELFTPNSTDFGVQSDRKELPAKLRAVGE